MVFEVALCLLVVVSAGHLTRSFAELVRVDSGVQAEGRLTFGASLPASAYASPGAVRAGVNQLVRRLSAVPGVTSAAFTSSLPLTGAR